MRIDHVSLYVKNLEKAKAFFIKYFHATSNEKYKNPITKLETYFLTFDHHTRLEIMSKPNLSSVNRKEPYEGYHHIAFKLASKTELESLTRNLENDGYDIVNGPRITGDGYLETLFYYEKHLIELTYYDHL